MAFMLSMADVEKARSIAERYYWTHYICWIQSLLNEANSIVEC